MSPLQGEVKDRQVKNVTTKLTFVRRTVSFETEGYDRERWLVAAGTNDWNLSINHNSARHGSR